MGVGHRTSYRTVGDLERAVRALSRHFDTDAVVIVGSQAILATFPEAPARMRASAEIDAYPANASEWEAQHGTEASEEVNANFGYLSEFHRTHGFYIDGVDETTATLPPDWRDRQDLTPVECDGRKVRAVTPEVHDLVVSKLCRLESDDQEYVRALHKERPLDLGVLRDRIDAVETEPEIKARATTFVDGMA